jgi:hypothetical protein
MRRTVIVLAPCGWMSVHSASGSETAARVAVVGTIATLSALLHPGVVAGVAAGDLLRQRGFRWTWTVVPAAMSLAAAVLVAPSLVAGLSRRTA